MLKTSSFQRPALVVAAVAALSVATVWMVYSLHGRWPPFYSAYLATGFLATTCWLVIVAVIRMLIGLSRERNSIRTLLGLMTIIAGICAGTNVIGYYAAVFAFVLLLVLASFIKNESNLLYSIRRSIHRRLSPWIGWLPGAFLGAATFIALHAYDVLVLGLNHGRFELPVWLPIVFAFCTLSGAMSQVIVTGTIFRWRAKSPHPQQRTMA